MDPCSSGSETLKKRQNLSATCKKVTIFVKLFWCHETEDDFRENICFEIICENYYVWTIFAKMKIFAKYCFILRNSQDVSSCANTSRAAPLSISVSVFMYYYYEGPWPKFSPSSGTSQAPCEIMWSSRESNSGYIVWQASALPLDTLKPETNVVHKAVKHIPQKFIWGENPGTSKTVFRKEWRAGRHYTRVN